MNETYPFEQWLKDTCGVIRNIADADYQQRIWINGEGPEVGSYVESMCTLFDDHNIDLLIWTAKNERLLPTDQIEQLEAFRDALNRYSEPQKSEDDRVIVNDPRWAEIRAHASNLLQVLPT
jgi:dissimilatory sulfite reductase (desulfoviridin) alpha/beta subunit